MDAPCVPCRSVLKTRVACEACGKVISVHTYKYKHVCQPMVDRIQRATEEGRATTQARAEAL
eukprot:15391377-Alexandrium_andersonii.AAC.1